MNISEFIESKRGVAIHCQRYDDAIVLLQKFDEAGLSWCSGTSYVNEPHWDYYGQRTGYDNTNGYGSIEWYREQGYLVVEFEDMVFDEATLSISKDELFALYGS